MTEARILVVDDHFELAELLCAALENEGLRAVVALTGAEAMAEARSSQVALAVVDLVLPDMLGTELLDALAALDPPVPTVAMSGIFRGERYNRDLTQKHGAHFFLEKPFSTSSVVQDVLDLLRKLQGLPPESEAPVEEDEPLYVGLPQVVHLEESDERDSFPAAAEILGDEELLEQALDGAEWDEEQEGPLPLDPIPAPEGTPAPRPDDLERGSAEDRRESSKPPPSDKRQGKQDKLRRQMGFVEDLIEVARPESGAENEVHGPLAEGTVERPLPVNPNGNGARRESREPADTRHAALDPALPTLSPSARAEQGKPVQEAPSRGGEIGTSTVPRLLAAFHEAQSSGALELQRGKVTKVVYLREGQPTFAASNLAGDRLIRFAVSRGVVRREDADSALALATEEGRRIGEVLIELGVLDKKSLQRLVRDQVRAIIWSTFAWREGRFAIRPHKEGKKEPITLNLPVGRLIVEGTLRAVPLLVLREDVPDEIMLAPQPSPSVSLESLGLAASRARLLVAADGTKTVADLLALSDEDEKTVRAFLRALWDLGLLAPREQVESRSRRIGFVV